MKPNQRSDYIEVYHNKLIPETCNALIKFLKGITNHGREIRIVKKGVKKINFNKYLL